MAFVLAGVLLVVGALAGSIVADDAAVVAGLATVALAAAAVLVRGL